MSERRGRRLVGERAAARPLLGHVEQDRALPPRRVRPPQLHDPRLDRRRHLRRTRVRLRAAIQPARPDHDSRSGEADWLGRAADHPFRTATSVTDAPSNTSITAR